MTDRHADLDISTCRPWRCRWFGHRWVSTITGNPIDGIMPTGTAGPSFVACSRCGARHA